MKTTDELMNAAASLIIKAAYKQERELVYSFDEALGDIIGSIVYNVDVIFYNKSSSEDKISKIRPTETEIFLNYFKRQVDHYVEQANAERKRKEKFNG